MNNIFVASLLVHLVADWLLQNEWMALNKVSLNHSAAWMHSGIHTIGLLFVYPWWLAVLVGISHVLIDTRVPVQWWRKIYRQTQEGPIMLSFAMWQDQAIHLIILCMAALWLQ